MKSLDYKIYKELGRSYLQDAKNSIKNIISKPIRTLTLAAMLGVYACSGSGNDNENNIGGGTVYECNNNQDDDGDALVDYPADPGCSSATDNNEYNAVNNPPVALSSITNVNPSNQYHPGYVHPGNTVTVDSSASYDPDGDPIAKENYLVAKPAGSGYVLGYLGNTDEVFFTPDVQSATEPYTLEARIFDSSLLTDSAFVDVLAVNNNAPVADAGPNQFTSVGIPVLIDGSNSSDSDGSIIECKFTFEDNGQVYTETPTSAPDGLFDCKIQHTFFTTNTNCRDPPSCINYGWKVDLQVKDDDSANSNINTAYVRVDP